MKYIYVTIIAACVILFISANNSFEDKLILRIKLDNILGRKQDLYRLSDYINDDFDGIIFYNTYNDEFYKFKLFGKNNYKGIRIKIDEDGELSKNQLLINLKYFSGKNIHSFKCYKNNSYIRYMGFNETLKSYDFYPIGCKIIYN